MLRLAEENWEQVACRIEACEGPVAWAWFALPEQQKWQLIGLTARGATHTEDHLDQYDNIVLCTEELAPTEAAARFRSGQTGGRYTPPLAFGPKAEMTSPAWLTSERIGPPVLHGAWPRYYVDFSIQTNGSPSPRGRYDPLTGAGQRFHPDPMTAIAEMVYGVVPAVLGNELSARIRVTLPDHRVRFGSVAFDGGRTIVVIEEGRPGSATGLTLRAAWRDDAKDAGWKRADYEITQAGSMELRTAVVPAHMSLVIADREGRTLDQHQWSPERGDRPVDRAIPSEWLERLLIEGEHLTLEFKRQLDDDSPKRSFAEDVCAFANGAGGTVLVGVDDDRTVVGYDRPFSVSDQIHNIVRNHVKEPPAVRVERVELRGVSVFVVTVPPSAFEQKPHMVGTNVWLRAGGTTFRAEPSELRRLLTPPEPPNRFGIPGF